VPALGDFAVGEPVGDKHLGMAVVLALPLRLLTRTKTKIKHYLKTIIFHFCEFDNFVLFCLVQI